MDEKTVELWLARPEAALGLDSTANLDEEERARAGRFVFERDRRAYRVAHNLLRYALSEHTGVPPQRWEYSRGPHGRPEVSHPRSDLRFSLSHAPGLVGCVVVRDWDVGLDIEPLNGDRDLQALLPAVLTATERARLLAQPAEEQVRQFYSYWTLKEAFLKACGVGLGVAPSRVGFELAGGRIGVAAPASLACGPWEFSLHELVPGYGIATAIRAVGPIELKVVWPTVS